MNTDDHFAAYFADRAGEVRGSGAGSLALVARARRRRTRRNVVKLVAVVGVLAGAGAVLSRSPDLGQQRVASDLGAPARSTLDWDVVTPSSPVGSTWSRAITADGDVYRLSTAPGVAASERRTNPARLERTEDDRQWAPVALPDGFAPSSIAADDDRLLVVGTVPTGGDELSETESVRLLSGVGDGTWSSTDVPLDLSSLAEGFPGRVAVSSTSVGVGPGGAAVVAVDVQGLVVDEELPDGIGRSAWRPTADGIEVVPDPCSSELDGGSTTTVARGSGDGGTAPEVSRPSEPPAIEGAGPDGITPAGGVTACAQSSADPALVGLHTWDELAIDPAAGDLVLGRTHVFTVEPAAEVEQVADLATHTWHSSVLGTSDGWWLVWPLQPSGTVTDPTTSSRATFAADGRSWSTDEALEIPGRAGPTGVLHGEPAVAAADAVDGGLTINLLDPSGIRTIDVATEAGHRGELTAYTDPAFGPLGFAVVETSGAGTSDERSRVLHSSDGRAFAVEDLPPAPDDRVEVADDIAVSAHAIVVQLDAYDPDVSPTERDATVATQRLFVGTPG